MNKAFTIVELLIVIVVIALLAAITVVSYDAVFNRTSEVSLKSDLRTASDALELYKFEDSSKKYPPNFENVGVNPSGDSEFTYFHEEYHDNFCLEITSPSIDVVFHISNIGNNAPAEGPCRPLPAGLTSEACFAFSAGTITDYYYNEGNSSSNSSCPRDVVIPSSIGGVSVTTLGMASFGSDGITSVVIPNTVTEIGYNSFSGNQLTSLDIPNSVTKLVTGSFSGNNIKSVVIPNSVTLIGDGVFSNNNLTSVTISESLTSIGGYAFQRNQLTTVTIPNSVTTVGNGAFQNNSLGSVSLPSHLSSLRTNTGTNWAFTNNPSLSFTVRP